MIFDSNGVFSIQTKLSWMVGSLKPVGKNPQSELRMSQRNKHAL